MGCLARNHITKGEKKTNAAFCILNMIQDCLKRLIFQIRLTTLFSLHFIKLYLCKISTYMFFYWK